MEQNESNEPRKECFAGSNSQKINLSKRYSFYKNNDNKDLFTPGFTSLLQAISTYILFFNTPVSLKQTLVHKNIRQKIWLYKQKKLSSRCLLSENK